MSLRFAACSLGCTLLLAASLATASPRPVPASATLDSFPNAPDVILWPPHPCIENEVTVYVRGYQPTPCDSFLRAYRSGDREITIRSIFRADIECFESPTSFYAVPISFGTMPAGPQTVVISRHRLTAGSGGALDSTVTTTEIGFTVADACPDPPLPFPANELPFVDTVGTFPSPPCPNALTDVTFQGHFDDGCGHLISAALDNGIPKLVLTPYQQGPGLCPALPPPVPWGARVSLGLLAAGSYHTLIHETVQGTNIVWPPIPDFDYVGDFDFAVAPQCDSTAELPYVSLVEITPAEGDPSAKICPNSPIRVSLAGSFPNSCWGIRDIQLIDYTLGSPLPRPPVIRLLMDNCVRQVCSMHSTPWDTSIVLPGLPEGSYLQLIQVGLMNCTDSIPPDGLFSKQFPFSTVSSESCVVTPPAGCLLASWQPGASGCNAFLGNDGTASLSLRVSTSVALSGLQGELRFLQPGLRIDSLETLGFAVGMHLSWVATATGAKFVMFAEHGAPIPALTPQPIPVLEVHLVATVIPLNIPLPVNGFDLEADAMLGSDVDGQEVPSCPTFAFAPVIAHICFDRPCDFDGNGVADVRDLVRMVHCVNGDGPCPPNAGITFDCNGDSLFGLSDVLCCAVHLLRSPDCLDCPIDSTRRDPNLRAEFGDPSATAQGVDVPLRLHDAGELGAARLVVRFPGGYDLAGVTLSGSSWLELHEASDGRAAIGLIALAPSLAPGAQNESSSEIQLLLHLARKPGVRPGGEIALESGEFSAFDGVMLQVTLDATPRSLDGQAALTIGAIHPNPSAGVFHISLGLTAPARLDVAVLDLAGRRVASLFHGDQPAGARELQWDGRSDDGVPLHGGVYFLRASVGSRAAVKKLILMSRGGPHALPSSP